MLSLEDLAALRDHVRAVEEAVRTRDGEAWAACFIEEGVFVPPNQPSVHGRSALVEYGNGLPEISAFAFSDVHFEGSGDVAVGWSAYEMTMLIDGQEVKDVGSQLFYCVGHTDGSWQVVRWMYNSDFLGWG